MAKKPSSGKSKSNAFKPTVRSTSGSRSISSTKGKSEGEISFGRTGVRDYGVDLKKGRRTPRG